MDAMSEPTTIYIPAPASILSAMIKDGSGIVGPDTPDANGRILVDYEGNLHGASNFRTYADRVYHAYDRAHTKYPTIARSYVKPGDLITVGTFEPVFGTVDLGPDAGYMLAGWLGLSPDQLPPELLSTHDTHVSLRTVRGWTPEQRQQLSALPQSIQEHYRRAGLI